MILLFAHLTAIVDLDKVQSVEVEENRTVSCAA
jgi:hypothetical protein